MTDILQDEFAETVHGRLLEAVHISGYSFSRACGELEWLLEEDRWKKVGKGYDDIDTFISTINFSEFKIAVEQRKGIAKKLADLKATQRAVGKMLGVTHTTVQRDLDDGTNVPIPETDTQQIQDVTYDVGTNVPTPPATITQGGTQAAQVIKNEIKKIEVKEEKIKEREENIKTIQTQAPPPLTGTYKTIIIDPPWPYESQYDSETRRSANPYPSMSIEEIKAIELPAEDACILWLWTTHAFLEQSFGIMRQWGFDYKALMVWDKEKIGLGYWLRMQCEFVMLGIKGKPQWLATDIRDIIREPGREHSRKPEIFYEIVKKYCPQNRLDYFARTQREGFIPYGNEVQKYEVI